MIFEYSCQKCKHIIEKQFPVGKADETVPCPTCNESCGRHYGEMNFILKGGGWPGKSLTFNKEMTQRNEDAGKRMHGTWGNTAPKLIPNIDGKPL